MHVRGQVVVDVVDDICALPDAVLPGNRSIRPVGQAQLPPGGHDEDRPPHQRFRVDILADGLLDGVHGGEHLEGAHDLLDVRRPDDEQVRHRAQLRQHLDGLVRGPVLAEVDGVVRADVQHGKLRDARHADRRQAVLVEDGEERGEGYEARGRGEAVQDGQASVLADAEVDVAARVACAGVLFGVGRRQEVALDLGEVAAHGAGHVRGAPDHGGVHAHEVLQDLGDINPAGLVLGLRPVHLLLLGRGLRRGLPAVVGAVQGVRQRAQAGVDLLLLFDEVVVHLELPVVGEVLPVDAAVKVGDEVGLRRAEGAEVQLHELLPLVRLPVALRADLPEAPQDPPRHEELRQDGRLLAAGLGQLVQLLLHHVGDAGVHGVAALAQALRGEPPLADALEVGELAAVHAGGALDAWAGAGADGRLHDHDRGPLLLRLRLLHCLGVDSGVEGRAVDAQDIPVVRGEPGADVLAEGQVRLSVDRGLVVVVEDDELVQAQVAGEGRRLGGDALHQAAVAGQAEDIVVEEREVLAVESR
mmetsp:Transcript_38592/g.111312  ORF Transcript_38592/g.111312 Transcript_38592/m.111312 type:complete len:529 (-) Transcript_38592:377-1963(-)